MKRRAEFTVATSAQMSRFQVGDVCTIGPMTPWRRVRTWIWERTGWWQPEGVHRVIAIDAERCTLTLD